MLRSRTIENKLKCKQQVVSKFHPGLRVTEVGVVYRFVWQGNTQSSHPILA